MLPQGPSFTKYLDPSIPNSFFCNNISKNEILEQFNRINKSYSAGSDIFNSKLICNVALQIIEPLCYIYNLSLKTGKFPHRMKIAKVIPIHKRDDHTTPGNYRTISLLSIFSKIL